MLRHAIRAAACAGSGALLTQCEAPSFTKPGTYYVGEDGKLFAFEPAAPVILNGKRFSLGKTVEAKYRGEWCKAVVKATHADHLVVHWLPPHDRWGDADWFPHNAADVRAPPAAPGVVAGKAFKVGERVEALYRGEWYECVVEDVANEAVRVRWCAPHAEWGTADWTPHDATDIRLRGGAPAPRKPVHEAFAPGMKVEAMYRNAWYDATVREVAGESLTLEWAPPHHVWGTASWHPHSPADVRHKTAVNEAVRSRSTLVNVGGFFGR